MLIEAKPNIALVHRIFLPPPQTILPMAPCHLSPILVMTTCNQENVETEERGKKKPN